MVEDRLFTVTSDLARVRMALEALGGCSFSFHGKETQENLLVARRHLASAAVELEASQKALKVWRRS